MKGLRRRIEAIIEEVNHELRVNLGLVQPAAEEQQGTIAQAFDFMQEEFVFFLRKVKSQCDSPIAFERVLNEIEHEYKAKCSEIEREYKEKSKKSTVNGRTGNSGKALETIIANL